VATGGTPKFAEEAGAPQELFKLAAAVEVAVPIILRHIDEAVKVEKPTTFWSVLGPTEVPFWSGCIHV